MAAMGLLDGKAALVTGAGAGIGSNSANIPIPIDVGYVAL